MIFASALLALTVLGSSVANADNNRFRPLPNAPQTNTSQILRASLAPGFTISSVRGEGALGGNARFSVTVLNNTSTATHAGLVYVNSNSPGNPRVTFGALQPGQTQTVMLDAPGPINQGTTYQFGVVLDPNYPAETWNGVTFRALFDGSQFRISR